MKWKEVADTDKYKNSGLMERYAIRKAYFNDFVKTKPNFPQDPVISAKIEDIFTKDRIEKEKLPSAYPKSEDKRPITTKVGDALKRASFGAAYTLANTLESATFGVSKHVGLDKEGVGNILKNRYNATPFELGVSDVYGQMGGYALMIPALYEAGGGAAVTTGLTSKKLVAGEVTAKGTQLFKAAEPLARKWIGRAAGWALTGFESGVLSKGVEETFNAIKEKNPDVVKRLKSIGIDGAEQAAMFGTFELGLTGIISGGEKFLGTQLGKATVASIIRLGEKAEPAGRFITERWQALATPTGRAIQKAADAQGVSYAVKAKEYTDAVMSKAVKIKSAYEVANGKVYTGSDIHYPVSTSPDEHSVILNQFSKPLREEMVKDKPGFMKTAEDKVDERLAKVKEEAKKRIIVSSDIEHTSTPAGQPQAQTSTTSVKPAPTVISKDQQPLAPALVQPEAPVQKTPQVLTTSNVKSPRKMLKFVMQSRKMTTEELEDIAGNLMNRESLTAEEQSKLEVIDRELSKRDDSAVANLSDEDIDKIVKAEEGRELSKPEDEKSPLNSMMKDEVGAKKEEPIVEKVSNASVEADVDSLTTPPQESVISPVEKVDLASKSPELHAVTLQTVKGAQVVTMSKDELDALNSAITDSYKTKKPATYKGLPVIKVQDSYKINLGQLGNRGYIIVPGSKEVAEVYDQLSRTFDPVRSSHESVARVVMQRGIDQHTLAYNISKAADNMRKYVADKDQREAITSFIETGGKESYVTRGGKRVDVPMTPQMHIVANLIKNGQDAVGNLAVDKKVIRNMVDNYMKHLVQDPKLTLKEVQAKIQWAVSLGKISKYVEAKLPRAREEVIDEITGKISMGEIKFPTIKSLEDAGYKVVTKDAVDLYEYTMMSEGVALNNASMADNLSRVPYVDPRDPKRTLYQMMYVPQTQPNRVTYTTAKGELKEKWFSDTGLIDLKNEKGVIVKKVDNFQGGPGQGFRLGSKGVFMGKWISPEAYPAIQTLAEPRESPQQWRKTASLLKQFKFLIPFYHGMNWYGNLVATKGIYGGSRLFMEGVKSMENPENVSKYIQMGVNLFRINSLSAGVMDEMTKAGKWNLMGKSSEWLFHHVGDSLTAGITEELLRQTKEFGWSHQQINETIAEIVNNLSGNLSPETMSPLYRTLGSTLLMARDWTTSNIRVGTGALGMLPKYWSIEQKAFAASWYRKAMLREFGNMFVVAQVINQLTTKAAYGKGRFTWENSGTLKNKISPVFYVDKKTGREFAITNWYRMTGDIMNWVLPDEVEKSMSGASQLSMTVKGMGSAAIKHGLAKVHILPKEITQQLLDHDFFTWDKIALDGDGLMADMSRRMIHAGKSILPTAAPASQGRYGTPLPANIVRFFGSAVTALNPHQDIYNKLIQFEELQNRATKEEGQPIYKALATGNISNVLNAAKSLGMNDKQLEGRVIDFVNPMLHKYMRLNNLDKIRFLRKLDPGDRIEFLKALREQQGHLNGQANNSAYKELIGAK